MKEWYNRNKKWVYLVIGVLLLADLFVRVLVLGWITPLRDIICLVFGVGLTHKAVKVFRGKGTL